MRSFQLVMMFIIMLKKLEWEIVINLQEFQTECSDWNQNCTQSPWANCCQKCFTHLVLDLPYQILTQRTWNNDLSYVANAMTGLCQQYTCCHATSLYSAVSYARWVSCVGCEIFSAFWFGDTTNDYMKGIFLSDAILLLDIINLVKFRLEDGKESAHFNRSYGLNISKLIVLSNVILLLKSRIPIQMHYYGYFVYLTMCAICGLIVHFWTQQRVPSPH